MTDQNTMHTDDDDTTTTTTETVVAEGDETEATDDGAPDSTTSDNKLKGENKRLRQDRSRWEAIATAALQMQAETLIGTETRAGDPVALLARLKPLHEYVDDETHKLKTDELVADANEFMRAITPKQRRDPDQGRGDARPDMSFGQQMRQGMRGA
jgi:hypothetical protein